MKEKVVEAPPASLLEAWSAEAKTNLRLDRVIPAYMEPRLTQWAEKDTLDRCLGIFRFAVTNWDDLRKQLNIKSDRLSVSILYGYRFPICRELRRRHHKGLWSDYV